MKFDRAPWEIITPFGAPVDPEEREEDDAATRRKAIAAQWRRRVAGERDAG